MPLQSPLKGSKFHRCMIGHPDFRVSFSNGNPLAVIELRNYGVRLNLADNHLQLCLVFGLNRHPEVYVHFQETWPIQLHWYHQPHHSCTWVFCMIKKIFCIFISILNFSISGYTVLMRESMVLSFMHICSGIWAISFSSRLLPEPVSKIHLACSTLSGVLSKCVFWSK